jgi:hypothetical protein
MATLATGVEFIAETGGGVGIRMRKREGSSSTDDHAEG